MGDIFSKCINCITLQPTTTEIRKEVIIIITDDKRHMTTIEKNLDKYTNYSRKVFTYPDYSSDSLDSELDYIEKKSNENSNNKEENNKESESKSGKEMIIENEIKKEINIINNTSKNCENIENQNCENTEKEHNEIIESDEKKISKSSENIIETNENKHETHND